MWENLFEMATQSGIWAVLFVCLFFIQIKDSKIREEKYQQTVDSLADKLNIVVEIKDSIEEIKSFFEDNTNITKTKE